METVILELPNVVRVALVTSLSFVLAMLITPLLTDVLYRYRLGKRIRDTDVLGNKAPIFRKFHAAKEHTPTLGGLLVWATTALVIILLAVSGSVSGEQSLDLWQDGTVKLLLFTLVATGVIGGLDDLLNIYGIGPHRGGFAFWVKLPLYLTVAGAGAWWFAVKLDWLHRPFHVPGWEGFYTLGWWYVPLFILVIVYLAFATDITDGLDGLAGGLLMIAYVTYLMIALAQQNIPLAMFCGIVVGALLAFLWFNIYPARFFMGDTGSMSLGMTLAVMAFLTNTVIALLLIAAVIILDGASSPLQIISKRFFKRKIFLSAPVHHHFQAIGWPEPKVVMRFWVLAGVLAVVGLALALFGQG
ncbi:hypothetical protein HY523_00390 [Candidatus Berkelbacteria bacterium]|nr:hypothetical protein [Candidatus Berkelbacteria bacterium]